MSISNTVLYLHKATQPQIGLVKLSFYRASLDTHSLALPESLSPVRRRASVAPRLVMGVSYGLEAVFFQRGFRESSLSPCLITNTLWNSAPSDPPSRCASPTQLSSRHVLKAWLGARRVSILASACVLCRCEKELSVWFCAKGTFLQWVQCKTQTFSVTCKRTFNSINMLDVRACYTNLIHQSDVRDAGILKVCLFALHPLKGVVFFTAHTERFS